MANYSVISDNILSNTYYSPCYGVYITSTRHNNVISGNTFLKSGIGFETKNLDQNTVTDNIVNGKSLVYLEGESGNLIFKYWPNSFKKGLIISLITLSLIVLFFILRYYMCYKDFAKSQT